MYDINVQFALVDKLVSFLPERMDLHVISSREFIKMPIQWACRTQPSLGNSLLHLEGITLVLELTQATLL